MKIISDIDTGVVSIIFESNEEKKQMHNALCNMLDDDKCMVFCYHPRDSINEKEKEEITENIAEIEKLLLKQRGSIDDILNNMEEEEIE